MKVLRNLILIVLATAFTVDLAFAQCGTWKDSPQKEEAENAHVLYRGFLKGKQVADLEKLDAESFNIALENWQKVYELAPAADGNRPSHYSDGRKIYKVLAKKETDAAKQKEYNDQILGLYDAQMVCYKNEAYLWGRKAFDMFYMPGYGYSTTTLDAFKKAIDLGGNSTEYLVMDPLGQLIKYLYTAKKMPKEDVITTYKAVETIAEHNIENNAKYSAYYKSGFANFKNHLKEIEGEVFDCAYFKEKLLPQFKENPEDLEVLKYVYVTLTQQGCDPEDPDLAEVKSKYETVAAEINAKLEIERRANNPCYDATQLQKEEKYEEAMARYQECLSSSEDMDAEAKAQVLYSMAFIQTWQFGQYAKARENARKAASLKPGWGKPFILIGDMYGKTSRQCGGDWDNRMAVLAAIDKYAYAKSIDPEVAADANKRIGQYSGAKPEKQEGFMRGIKEGQAVKVGCWIGETVKVRFK